MVATVHKLPTPEVATAPPSADVRKDWNAGVSRLVDGTYKVNLTTVEGRSGIPEIFGTIRLEKHPDLHPTLARGRSTNPGVFWDLANTPQVQAALNKPIRAISGANLRLEEAPLPPWATGADRAAAALHLDYCQRIWWRWMQEGALTDFARQTLWTAGVCGFAWYEIVGEVAVFEIGGQRREAWMPSLHWRAPWTVVYWVTQGERLAGIVGDFGQSYEWRGGSHPGYVTIPADKVLHIAPERVGTNWEGRSWLRSCYNWLLMLRQAVRLQALGAEVGALGEFIVERDQATVGGDEAQNELVLKQYIANRKATNVPGLLLPAGYRANIQKAGDSVPDLTGWIDQLERHVLLALDAEDEVIALQSAGSYAARETASADARDAYDYLTSQYVARPLESVLRRMIAASFPEHAVDGRVFVPRVAWSVVEERDNSAYLADLYAFAAAFPEARVRAMGAAASVLDLPEAGAETMEDV